MKLKDNYYSETLSQETMRGLRQTALKDFTAVGDPYTDKTSKRSRQEFGQESLGDKS